jgi:hypothetical protein
MRQRIPPPAATTGSAAARRLLVGKRMATVLTRTPKGSAPRLAQPAPEMPLNLGSDALITDALPDAYEGEHFVFGV